MAVDLARTIEAFSLSHAAILDGTTGAEQVDGDIYGVDEANLAPNIGNFDNEGDDTILSTWFWLNYAEITVQGGYVPFKLIALMTGETMTSSGSAGPSEYDQIQMWTDRSMNVAPKPMLVRMPAKDANGNPVTLDFVLYKVQFQPITFTGPKYKTGLKVGYSGRALMSANDETGTPLSTNYPVPSGTKAVGRLIKHL